MEFQMPKFRYSVYGLDPDRTAKASGRDLRISSKAAREICHALKDMDLDDAKEFLEDVIDMRKMVPLKRHKGKKPHHKGLNKWYAGAYPVKAANAILAILDNVEANAEYKGLDIDRCRLIHIAAHRAMKVRNYIPRAFGRSSPYFKTLTHVEVVVEEQ
jgi:large subunit ribosomal protein L22